MHRLGSQSRTSGTVQWWLNSSRRRGDGWKSGRTSMRSSKRKERGFDRQALASQDVARGLGSRRGPCWASDDGQPTDGYAAEARRLGDDSSRASDRDTPTADGSSCDGHNGLGVSGAIGGGKYMLGGRMGCSGGRKVPGAWRRSDAETAKARARQCGHNYRLMSGARVTIHRLHPSFLFLVACPRLAAWVVEACGLCLGNTGAHLFPRCSRVLLLPKTECLLGQRPR